MAVAQPAGPQVDVQKTGDDDSTVVIGAQVDLATSLDSPQEPEPDDKGTGDDAGAGAGKAGADDGTDATAGDGKAGTDKGTGTTPVKPAADPDALTAEVSNLRSIARNQRLQIATAMEKAAQLEKQIQALRAQRTQQKSKGLDDFDDDDAGSQTRDAGKTQQKDEPLDGTEPTVLQSLQDQLNMINSSRGPLIATIAETMQLNPAYADLATVCSKTNFADIVDMVAEDIAAEKGVPVTEAQLRVEIAVWSKPNPYKFMYDMIKKYHPSYAAASAQADGTQDSGTGNASPPAGKQSPAQKAAGKPPKPVDAPSSIHDIPTSSMDQGGWTAAKIDGLDEADLHTVPANIYKLYMSGDLK